MGAANTDRSRPFSPRVRLVEGGYAVRSMRGLVFEGVRRVTFRTDLPEPDIQEPTDALVEVNRAGLCGSDLHPYEGREPLRRGVVPGHEAVGEVIGVGHGVSGFSVGDRVIVPFTTNCGSCAPCRAGLTARCEKGELFGFGDPERPQETVLHGGQAERMRVPLASSTLIPLPDRLGEETALLLADNLPTGWYAAERAEVESGEPVAVVGLGAVGLSALLSAQAMGAGPMLAVDPVADRRARAERLGATAAHPHQATVFARRLAAGGFGAVIEAAGTKQAQALAFELLRPGGTLSVISVQTIDRFGVTPAEAYDRNVTIRLGRAPVRSVVDRVLEAIARRRLRVPTELLVTHPRIPLDQGPATYRRFASREQGMLKVAFVP